MFLRRFNIALSVTTTSDGGTDTAYTTDAINGLVHQISYTRSTAPFSSTASLTFTGEGTSQAIFALTASTASWVYFPRSRAIVDTTGDVINPTSAASTDSNNMDKIPIVNERIKVVVAETTVNQTGTVTIYVEGA